MGAFARAHRHRCYCGCYTNISLSWISNFIASRCMTSSSNQHALPFFVLLRPLFPSWYTRRGRADAPRPCSALPAGTTEDCTSRCTRFFASHSRGYAPHGSILRHGDDDHPMGCRDIRMDAFPPTCTSSPRRVSGISPAPLKRRPRPEAARRCLRGDVCTEMSAQFWLHYQ